MWEPNKYRLAELNPWNIVLIYLVLGFLWILFSDRLLEQLIDDPATLTQFQTYKGWFYVLITGLLLLLLLLRYSARITRMRSDFLERFDLYRSLLEQGNQVVFQVDDNQRFSYTNTAVGDILGYEEDQLNKMDDFETFIHQDDLERFHSIRKVCDSGIRNHDPVRHQIRMRHKDGTRRSVILNARAFFDDQDRMLYTLGNVVDMTEKILAEKELNEAYRRLNYHIQNTPLGFVEWDDHFRVTDWSPGAELIFGWSREEVRGKLREEWPLVHEDDRIFVQNEMDEMLAGRERRNVVSNRNYTRNGDVRHCEWYNSALLDDKGRLVSVMSLIHDITEQVQAREEIRKLNLSLEEKV